MTGSAQEPETHRAGSRHRRLVYKGDADYDVLIGETVIQLSYDGSDYGVGDWLFWGIRIGDQSFGGSAVLPPGSFVDWLEATARDERGLLRDTEGTL